MMEVTKTAVIYMTENNDLYSQIFNTRDEALDFIENTDQKCILVEGKDLMTESYT